MMVSTGLWEAWLPGLLCTGWIPAPNQSWIGWGSLFLVVLLVAVLGTCLSRHVIRLLRDGFGPWGRGESSGFGSTGSRGGGCFGGWFGAFGAGFGRWGKLGKSGPP